MIAVLRIASETLDVDSFLAQYPGLEPDAVWRTGGRRAEGVMRTTSGCNILLGEASEWPVVMGMALDRIQAMRPMLAVARGATARLELDFGLELGESDAFTASARFAPETLGALSEVGIELCVTVYPPSREAAGEVERKA